LSGAARRWLVIALLCGVPLLACGGGHRASEPHRNAVAERIGESVEPLACFGARRPMVISSHMPYVQVDVDGKKGWFVVDTGTTRSGLSRDWYGIREPLGTKVSRRKLQFFDTWDEVQLRVDDYSHIYGSVTQSGMIGTDLLASAPTVFDYANGALFRVPKPTFCEDATLRDHGMLPIALHDDTQTTFDREVGARLNIPTIDIDVGGVRAKAQLDTGLDDGWTDRPTPLSLNVNEALVTALRAAGHAPIPFGDPVKLTTCVQGALDVVQAVRLPPNATVALIDAEGRRWPVPDVTLYAKSGSGQCGGINAMQMPAIQVGASWFERWGVFALDPSTHRLWIRPPRVDPRPVPG
jgi:hypothetical protein